MLVTRLRFMIRPAATPAGSPPFLWQVDDTDLPAGQAVLIHNANMSIAAGFAGITDLGTSVVRYTAITVCQLIFDWVLDTPTELTEFTLFSSVNDLCPKVVDVVALNDYEAMIIPTVSWGGTDNDGSRFKWQSAGAEKTAAANACAADKTFEIPEFMDVLTQDQGGWDLDIAAGTACVPVLDPDGIPTYGIVTLINMFDGDSIEDFAGGFEFEQALTEPFKPVSQRLKV
jgi:hypothetical protein